MPNKTKNPATVAPVNALTVTNSRPIFDAFVKLQTMETRDAKARIKLYNALRDAGATLESLSEGGEHLPELADAVLTAWQGEKFAAAFFDPEGPKALKGKARMDPLTGKNVFETRPRKAWQQDLGSKIGKRRKAFVTWLEGVDAATADAVQSGASADTPVQKVEANKNAARNINVRIYQELRKLEEAIKKDIASDKSAAEFDPSEMFAAFTRAKDLIPRAHRVAK